MASVTVHSANTISISAKGRTDKKSYYMRSDGAAGSWAAATSPDAAATAVDPEFLFNNAASLDIGDTVYLSDQGGAYATLFSDGTGIDGVLIFPSDCIGVNFRPVPGEEPVIGDGTPEITHTLVKHNSSKGNRIYAGITYYSRGTFAVRQTTCDDWYEHCVLIGGGEADATQDGDGINENGGKLTFDYLTIKDIWGAINNQSITLHQGGDVIIRKKLTITNCRILCNHGTGATGRVIVNDLYAENWGLKGWFGGGGTGDTTDIIRKGTMINTANIEPFRVSGGGSKLVLNNITYTDTGIDDSVAANLCTVDGTLEINNCDMDIGFGFRRDTVGAHIKIRGGTIKARDDGSVKFIEGNEQNSTYDVQGVVFDLVDYGSTNSLLDTYETAGQTHTATPSANNTNELIDTGETFETDGVEIGYEAYNATTGGIARITNVTEDTLTLDADIFANMTDTYRIYKPRETHACFNGNVIKNWTLSGISFFTPFRPITFANNVFFNMNNSDKWFSDFRATSEIHNNIFNDVTLGTREIERNVPPASATTRTYNNYSGTTTDKATEASNDSAGGTTTDPDGTTAWTSSTTDFAPQAASFTTGGAVWWNSNAVDELAYVDRTENRTPLADPPIGAYVNEAT